MRRLYFLLLIAAVSLFCADNASAQHNFGVVGGATFSNASFSDFKSSTMTQYHAGATYRARLPLGFAIQPSLIYQVKGTNAQGLGAGLKVGYLELPVSFQWGPDLILFRPFLEVTPFVGYGLNNYFWSEVKGASSNNWAGLSRWEYGVGTGLGFDIWRFQLVARYNWNLGAISRDASLSEVAYMFRDGVNFGGVTLSLAFMFK